MHNIEHYSYEEKVDRDRVQAELDHVAEAADYGEGCTGLSSPIRWLEHVGIYPDYGMAERAIDAFDRGWYDQLAVRYYAPVKGFTSKRLEELKAKERQALDAYHAKDGIWAKTVKAEYVSCRTCGSKLKRELILTNRCPLCHNDLRPESTLAAVETARLRCVKAKEAIDDYIASHAKKRVMWLVKIEYHT